MTSTTVNTPNHASQTAVTAPSTRIETAISFALYAAFMLGALITFLAISQHAVKPAWVWGLSAWTALVGVGLALHTIAGVRAARRR